MDTVEMIAQIVIATASAVLAGALIFHRQAVSLQRKSIQGKMFSEILGRMSTIWGEIPQKGAKEITILNWYVRLFNEFESLIFLTRHKHLSREMLKYHRNVILQYVERVKDDFPKVAKRLKNDYPLPTFSEIRQYYATHKKKEAPW